MIYSNLNKEEKIKKIYQKIESSGITAYKIAKDTGLNESGVTRFVDKTTIENRKVRFSGVSVNALSYKSMGMTFLYDLRYTIEISFKDNKYKFEIITLERFVEAGQYNSAHWQTIPLNDGSGYYKKNGKIRSMSKTVPETIGSEINNIFMSLNNYIVNTDKDDW